MDTPSPAIAIDLDGCLAQYDGWVDKHHIGDPYPGSVAAVTSMVAAGYRVIIHTCRTLEGDGSPFDDGSTSEEAAATVQAWLAKHGFPAGIEVWTGRGKPYADAYVDDKAVPAAPSAGRWFSLDLDTLQELCPALKRVCRYCYRLTQGDEDDDVCAECEEKWSDAFN